MALFSTYAFAVFSVALSFLQNPHSSVITAQAQEMGRALVRKDYPTVVKYSHPTITQLIGGKEAAAGMLQKQMSASERQGILVVGLKFGKPSQLYIQGNLLQCTIPQSTEMRTSTGKLIDNTVLLCLSDDGGKNWTFTDPSQGLETLRNILPNISKNISIPPRERPQFIAN